jgi:WD40 repeat protein
LTSPTNLHREIGERADGKVVWLLCQILDPPGDAVGSLVFSPDGKILAAPSLSSPELYDWDLASGKLRATYKKGSHGPPPRLLRYTWDFLPGVFQDHSYVPLSVSITPTGIIMALGFDNCDEMTVTMWKAGSVPIGRR